MSLLTDKIKVSINSPKRTTVRTVGVSALAQTGKLSNLIDVDASNPNNDDVLIYDASTQKYVVKRLSASAVDVDGGFY